MGSVFGDNDEWTQAASEIATKVSAALRPIFDAYSDVRPREMVYIILDAAECIALGKIVCAKIKKDE